MPSNKDKTAPPEQQPDPLRTAQKAGHVLASRTARTSRTSFTPRKPRTSSRNSRGATTLMRQLTASPAFARFAERAETLRRMQTALESALPVSLATGSRVASIKRGRGQTDGKKNSVKVIIHADSGAVAVKLKQLAPTLTGVLTQQLGEVTGIEVKVQAKPAFTRPKAAIKPRNMSVSSKQALTSLAAGLGDDSPVKRALQRLLRNS